jgi:predicted DNA-binding ribbon-helix-helix protein
MLTMRFVGSHRFMAREQAVENRTHSLARRRNTTSFIFNLPFQLCLSAIASRHPVQTVRWIHIKAMVVAHCSQYRTTE